MQKRKNPLKSIEKSTIYNTSQNNKIFSNKGADKSLGLTQRNFANLDRLKMSRMKENTLFMHRKAHYSKDNFFQINL